MPYSTKIVIGDVGILVSTREVYYQNQLIEVTGLEFNLLWLLMKNTPEIVSRECIAKDIFNRSLGESSRSINMHISNLRKKLFTHTGSLVIKTIRGEGYLYLM